MKIAVAYVRVSTNKQDIRGSKLGQEQEIKNYASKEGYNIVAFFDDTEHGDIANRVGLDDLKKYLRMNDSVKYVIVYHSDRFTRGFQNGIQDLFFLDGLGIKLVSVMEGIQNIEGNYDSLPTIVRMLGAQVEKDKMVKKVTTAMYQYAETSRYLGGSIFPWFAIEKGYIDGKRCKIVVQNKDTWDFYRRFFLTMIQSKSIKSTAEKFGLNLNTVQSWLVVPELIGKRSYGKKGKIDKLHNKGRRQDYLITEKIVFPALLTKEEYDQLLYLRHRHRIQVREDIKIYLYSQALYCGCGGKFEGNFVRKIGKEGKGTAYYRCSKCGKRINAKKLEHDLIDRICNDSRLQMLNEVEFRLADLFDEKTEYEKQINILREKERRVIHLVTDGITSMDVVEAELRALKKQRDHFHSLINKIDKTIQEEAQKEITEDNIKMLKELLILNFQDHEFRISLKEIVNLIIRKITIGDTDGKIYIIF